MHALDEAEGMFERHQAHVALLCGKVKRDIQGGEQSSHHEGGVGSQPKRVHISLELAAPGV